MFIFTPLDASRQGASNDMKADPVEVNTPLPALKKGRKTPFFHFARSQFKKTKKIPFKLTVCHGCHHLTFF